MDSQDPEAPAAASATSATSATAAIVEDNDVFMLLKEEVEGLKEALDTRKKNVQIVAAVCLAIVHASLLKAILDKSHEGSKYFSALLGLVIATLVIQVIVGLITIYVTNLNYTNRTHKSGSRQNCCIHFCNCQCEHADRKKESSLLSINSIDEGSRKKFCCAKAEYEYELIRKHEERQLKLIQSEMRRLKGTILLEYLKGKIADLKKSNDDGTKEKIAEIEEEVKQIEGKDLKYENIYAQATPLPKHAKAISDKRTMKRVSFWQNTITILLFIAFILDVFIMVLEFSNVGKSVSGETTPSLLTIGPN